MKQRWLSYYAHLAETTALMSRDPSTKVGALIIDSESKAILATGFNGFPRGVQDDLTVNWDRYQGEERYLHTCHAELNSILHAARAGTKVVGTTIICNRLPCVECTKAIIQSGITQIYFRWTPDLDTVNLEDMTNWRAKALKYVPQWCMESGINIHYYNYPPFDSRVDKPVITDCFQVIPRTMTCDSENKLNDKDPNFHQAFTFYDTWRIGEDGMTALEREWMQHATKRNALLC